MTSSGNNCSKQLWRVIYTQNRPIVAQHPFRTYSIFICLTLQFWTHLCTIEWINSFSVRIQNKNKKNEPACLCKSITFRQIYYAVLLFTTRHLLYPWSRSNKKEKRKTKCQKQTANSLACTQYTYNPIMLTSYWVCENKLHISA